MRFQGTKAYVATDDLKVAVNAAITLERPCWSRRARTGKTVLAIEMPRPWATAARMACEIHHQACRASYEYDAVSRLPDSQLGERRRRHPQLHQARQ